MNLLSEERHKESCGISLEKARAVKFTPQCIVDALEFLII